ncbi:unnamed protein product [Haemonchus placei]|uniref:Transmembrane protein n=1 Tax=Haemonchus placei TaxID=6290 RepID=A0A0N4X6H1_HAEPC|nr:unnamed protein product [Haemonchus placei]
MASQLSRDDSCIQQICPNRMRFELILVFLSLVSICGAHDCHKIGFSAWHAYEHKKIRILYDEQYIHLAKQIGCSLSTLNISNKDYLTPLHPGHRLKELCVSSDFLSHASPLHLTITITEAVELEEICIPEIAALHLKKLGDKWKKMHLLPVSAIAMIFCVAIVGAFTYVARRRKAGDEQRSLQNRRAEQLSDWGQSPEPRLALPDDDQKRENLGRTPTELPALAEAVSNTDLGCTDPLLPELEKT